jgi:hypothetical protein
MDRERKKINFLLKTIQKFLFIAENALAWIDQYYGESELSGQLQVLKNKVKFRELIKELFPLSSK